MREFMTRRDVIDYVICHVIFYIAPPNPHTSNNDYRIDARPQAMLPPKDGAEKHDEGEDREKLRRSLENDDTGLPNFVQWS